MESKMQDHYEAGNAMYAELEKVTAERDALAAQVEVLGDKLSEVVALLDVDGMTAVQWLLDNCQEIESLTNMGPQQHLAEIRAQAVEYAADQLANLITAPPGLHSSAVVKLNRIADSIRRGEVK